MLGDGVCNSQCLTSACDYDKRDCETSLCGVGCLPDMQGNGICETECYSQACLWDMSDCDCSPGCVSTMIGNGVCDDSCYTEGCAWDLEDCGCAAGCRYSDLGQCKPECLVSACNYDSWAWSSSPCLQDSMVFQCSVSCSETVTWYDYKFECKGELACCDTHIPIPLPNCDFTFSTNSLVPINDRVLPDLTSEQQPMVYYIINGDAKEKYTGSGSSDNPFQSLSQAIDQVNLHYVDLVLAPGEYWFPGHNSLSTCYSMNDASSNSLFHLKQSFFPVKRLRIRSQTQNTVKFVLRMDYNERCHLNLPVNLTLEIRDVVFVRDGDWYICSYSWAPCNTALISVPKGATLSLVNVTFQDLLNVGGSGIFLMDAKLYMTDVNFVNTNPNLGDRLAFYGVITSNSSAEVTYKGGSVSQLGKDYYFNGIAINPFINLKSGNVHIEGVQFIHNSVRNSMGLITVKTCFRCLISKCVFAGNYATIIKYDADSLQGFSSDWKQAKRIAGSYLEITECVFRNNTGRTGASIVVRFGSVLQRVVIRNCSFLYEYSETYGVVSITSSGYSLLASTGFWKYANSDSEHKHNVSFPAISIAIEDSEFINCTVGSFGVLHLAQLPHVFLANITFKGSGNFGNVDVFTTTVNALPSEHPGELSATLRATPLSTCLSILNFTNVEDIVIAGMKYTNFSCSQGVFLSNCTNGHFGYMEIGNNEGLKSMGAVVFLNLTGKLTVDNLYHYDNRNNNPLGQGTFALLGNSLIAHIANSRFERNWATYGSALFLYSPNSVTVSDSHFIANAAGSGGTIGLELTPQQDANLILIRLEVRGNSAVDFGGAVAVMLWQSSASVSLHIDSTEFLGNRGSVGSVLHISTFVSLLPNSSMTHSYVAHNLAAKDATMYLTAGHFLLINVTFSSNIAKIGAALYRDCPNSPCVLSLTNVFLLNNTSESIISLPFTQLKSMQATGLTCIENNGKCLMLEFTTAQCENCLFRGNRAVSGAAFHLLTSNLTIHNSSFEYNSVQAYGGAGLLEDSSWLSCNYCDFANNSAGRLGGALHVHSSLLSVSFSKFSCNTAENGGFAVELYRCSDLSSITASAFTRNYGEGTGVLSILSADLSLSECLFEGNLGLILTGGIHAYSSNLKIYKCQFRGQTGYSGVFLSLSQSSKASIEASNFSNGIALSSGGAATIIASAVQFTGCQFSSLSAQFGGALFLQNSAKLQIWSSEFRDINATNKDRGVISGYRSIVEVHGSLFTNFTQSAIAGQRMSLLHAVNSEFTYATGNKGGGLICMDCSQISISSSHFERLKAETGGALYFTGNSSLKDVNWTISDSRFDSCEAKDGGAVYAETCPIAISNCSFLNNTAAGGNGRGGAILLVAQSPAKSEIRSSSFSGNVAGLKGGGLCWEGSQTPPALIANQYLKNAAQYGKDVASFPVNLTLKSAATLYNEASGQVSNASIVLDLVDHYGQVVPIDTSSFAQINSYNVTGTTRVPISDGSFTFSDYSITATPGTNTSLSISTTALPVLVTVHVQMRNCTIGEALTNEECVPCAANSYNLVAGASCAECPVEAQCLGNYTMIPRSGYWRGNSYTDRFLACPYPQACKGYPEVFNLTGECEEGYEGNKCQTCSKAYFRWSRIRCSKCPSSLIHSLGQLGLWIAVLLTLILLIKLSTQAVPSTGLQLSTYLKIFLNYLQLVMLFDSFHLAWPELLMGLFNAQEAVGGFPEYLFSFSCLYADESELQGYYRKLIVLAMLLPALVGVSCCLWLLVAFCKRSISAVRNEMTASGIILFFMTYPSVMRVLLGALHCEEILPGKYWVVGLDLLCWQSDHLKYALGLVLPCLLIWGVAVPAGVLLFLMRRRDHINEADDNIRYGFLVRGYREGLFYWEYVVIYRKLLVIVFIVFFSQVSLFLQVLSTLGLLLGSIVLQQYLRPYSQPALNSLEFRSLLVTTITLYSGLFFYSESVGEVGQVLIFVVISLLNIAFAALCLAKIAYRGLVTVAKKVTMRKNKTQVQSEQEIAVFRGN